MIKKAQPMEVKATKDVTIYNTTYKKGDTLKVSPSVYEQYKGSLKEIKADAQPDKKDTSKRSK